jgi:hypothetical protein
MRWSRLARSNPDTWAHGLPQLLELQQHATVGDSPAIGLCNDRSSS